VDTDSEHFSGLYLRRGGVAWQGFEQASGSGHVLAVEPWEERASRNYMVTVPVITNLWYNICSSL
jgi:hypothetical protein